MCKIDDFVESQKSPKNRQCNQKFTYRTLRLIAFLGFNK